MNWLMWLNVISSGILAIAVGAFLVFLFGRENSLIHKLGVKSLISVKVALSFCASGALYNVLTLSSPPPSEVMVNAGFAFLFCWAAVFHYNRFVKPLTHKASKKSATNESAIAKKTKSSNRK